MLVCFFSTFHRHLLQQPLPFPSCHGSHPQFFPFGSTQQPRSGKPFIGWQLLLGGEETPPFQWLNYSNHFFSEQLEMQQSSRILLCVIIIDRYRKMDFTHVGLCVHYAQISVSLLVCCSKIVLSQLERQCNRIMCRQSTEASVKHNTPIKLQ